MSVMPVRRRPRLAAPRLRRLGSGRRRFSPPHPSRRLVIALLVLLLLGGGAWMWLRDSSLVAVRHVSIEGNSGPDQPQIRVALIRAARNMTTLDVQTDQLRTAVAPYPVVKDVQASTQFPHGLRIHVIEQIPVGAVDTGGRLIAVASDGTLLRDLAAGALPTITMRIAPGGAKLSDADARRALAVLAAAPYAMLAHISQVTGAGAHGIVAQLRSGPSIQFGDASRLNAKWEAAAAVLADPGSAGASYVNVSDPVRAAAGVTPGQAGLTATAGSGAAAVASTASSVASAAGAAGTASTGG